MKIYNIRFSLLCQSSYSLVNQKGLLITNMRVLFSLLVGAQALSISTQEEYNEEFNLAEHEEELASFLQVTAEDEEDDANAVITAEDAAQTINDEEIMENGGDASAFFQTEDWYTNATDSALLQEPISWSDRSFGAWSVTSVPPSAECKPSCSFYINQNGAHRQYGRVIQVQEDFFFSHFWRFDFFLACPKMLKIPFLKNAKFSLLSKIHQLICSLSIFFDSKSVSFIKVLILIFRSAARPRREHGCIGYLTNLSAPACRSF